MPEIIRILIIFIIFVTSLSISTFVIYKSNSKSELFMVSTINGDLKSYLDDSCGLQPLIFFTDKAKAKCAVMNNKTDISDFGHNKFITIQKIEKNTVVPFKEQEELYMYSPKLGLYFFIGWIKHWTTDDYILVLEILGKATFSKNLELNLTKDISDIYYSLIQSGSITKDYDELHYNFQKCKDVAG